MKLETLPRAAVQPTVSPRRWKAPLAALLVAVLAGGGWYAMQAPAKPAAPAPAMADGKPVIDTYELGRGDIAAVSAGTLRVRLPLSGSLTPLTQATVRAKVPGVVMDADVREGMQVAAGQVIARIEQADLGARVAQQQAMLDEASARLSLARKNNQNSQALLKQNYISQQAYDTTQNSVELAQANVKAAQAQLQLARNALNDTAIRAPFAGIISKRHVQAGEKLAPDMPVFTIVNLKQLTLEAQVPASEIPRIKTGQAVQFRVDGYPGREFGGKVARINPTTEVGSRAMLVYISVDNADTALSGGMFAKGFITTDQSAPLPLVPLAAVRQENNSDVVYTIEANKVVARPVTLGLRNEDDGMVAVKAGLQDGATVLLGKLDGVKPGSKVKLPAAPVVVAAKG
ncbi:efflux RND transporter periplasmic adaptor subunit [Massilia sp. PAMC28688]|uniref:efflux RND transporter periplasmic adaptor subunit n=1 Tax=Massilia sp. PAMC28688 TaxID=2861283 RepID=UPI001C62C9A5|nr:efflux RND transporter periplasmic adaptor subunit [Massilia sp. PAMC28688]QYF91684.1 efflux RND transporter periplasmic adaptor subunit [Massilia sp. PAMC28688]